MKKLTLLMVALMATTMIAFAQTTNTLAYPEVGKKMPDFTVRNIKYFKKTEASFADFKGKWLVLDFWNKGCGACFAAFPITNKIHEQMGDKVQVILVGIQDKEGQIYKIYDKFRERLHLTMPCAFDSTLAKRFDVYTAPHIVIVDPNGVVQSVTYAVNQEDMKGFLAGNPPNLPQTYYRMHDDRVSDKKFKYDPSKPFLVDNNGAADSDFICRSVLSRWNGAEHRIYAPEKIESLGNGKFEALGVPLEYLYRYAFFGVFKWGYEDTALYGKYSDKLILDVHDSANFRSSYKYSTGLFSYSLILPNRNAEKDQLESAMQKDLQIYFGYYVSIEKRKCPCLRLIATKEAIKRLRAKGGSESFEGMKDASFKARNFPFKQMVDYLRNYRYGIIVDETGIEGNVDIDMDCVMTNLEDVKKALKANGLDLIDGEKEMFAIVVRDRENKNLAIMR